MRVYILASDIGGSTRGACLGPTTLALHDSMHDRVLQGASFFTHTGSEEALYAATSSTADQAVPAVHNIAAISAYNQALSATIAQQADLPALFLSGDHSSAIGIISGLLLLRENLGVIWVDAHADINTPKGSPTGNMHGMPLGALLEMEEAANQQLPAWDALRAGTGGLPANRLVYIGARSVDPYEEAIIDRYGITRFTVPQAQQMGMETVAAAALHQLSACESVLVSFDIDVLDEQLVPGTGTPVAGGFSQEEALALNTALLSSHKVQAFELTEFNPLLDTTRQTISMAYQHMSLAAAVLSRR